MLDPLDWLGFAAFIIAVMVCGIVRARRPQEFLVANRRVGFLVLIPTLVMTEFNTTTLLAFSALLIVAMVGFSANYVKLR